MVDTNGKDIWLRDLDAREVFPLGTEFLGLAKRIYKANIQHQSIISISLLTVDVDVARFSRIDTRRTRGKMKNTKNELTNG